MSCNVESVVCEPKLLKSALEDESRVVNIVVDNQAEGVVFATDSVELHCQERGVCKTFETEKYYIGDIILHGSLYTPHYTIYSGDIRIPIRQDIQDSINYIDVTLYDGCPWYSESGNKILQSIQFGEPNVEEDWREATEDQKEAFEKSNKVIEYADNDEVIPQ